MSGVTYTAGFKQSLFVTLFFWLTPIYINFMMFPSIRSLINLLLMSIIIYGMVLIQHAIHQFTGKSSVHIDLNIAKKIFVAGIALSLAPLPIFIYINISIWMWIISLGLLGISLAALYSISRDAIYSNEFIIAPVVFLMFIGSYIVFTGSLPLAKLLLMYLSISLLYWLLLFCYRVITGDYGCPIDIEVVSKLVILFFVSLILFGIALII